ncbi:uncharacterized protein N0V89_007491 [Didymosphaeria variabile]|uniref:Uncharacterized protein n=1 Tax=Didymosphaeria variabile TaxID=1932322 RepID=A0A9W8XJ82_9PLEO|nr:uncharacterized protein N0V89_007491 [Didymosphaeria variabile]KAJ4352144.1 hypothetical protein N0V89_007491 [Didymosphaeria variabile]
MAQKLRMYTTFVTKGQLQSTIATNAYLLTSPGRSRAWKAIAALLPLLRVKMVIFGCPTVVLSGRRTHELKMKVQDGARKQSGMKQTTGAVRMGTKRSKGRGRFTVVSHARESKDWN